MRAAGLLLIIAACAHHDSEPDAGMCGPTVVYLNRTGGMFDHAKADDATQNLSVLLDGPRMLDPWPASESDWSELTACIGTALQPFAIEVTEVDPGATPHLEIVFTTEYWANSAVTNIVPSPCRPGFQIEIMFGNAIADPTRACELAMSGFAEMTALLSPGVNCHDYTSPAADCDIQRFFVDVQQNCVDPTSNEPAPCRCGGTTEDTFTTLSARFPACP